MEIGGSHRCEQFYLLHIYRKEPIYLNTFTLNSRVESLVSAPQNLQDVKSLPGLQYNIPFDRIGNYEWR
jgi:hypothetical protein